MALALALLGVLAASSSTVAAQSVPVDDTQLAQAALLTAENLPVDWTATAAPDAAAGDSIRAGIKACKGYQATLVATRQQPRAVAPHFANANASVDSSVTVFPSDRESKRTLKIFKDRSVATCLRKTAVLAIRQSTKQAGSKAVVSSVSAKRAAVPQAGNEAAGWEVVTRIVEGSQEARIFTDFEVARVGRSLAVFNFQDVGQPFPALRDSFVTIVVSKLGTA